MAEPRTGVLGGRDQTKFPIVNGFFQDMEVSWANRLPGEELITEGEIVCISQPETVRESNPDQVNAQMDGNSNVYGKYRGIAFRDLGMCTYFLGINPQVLTNQAGRRTTNNGAQPTRAESVATWAQKIEPCANRGTDIIQIGQPVVMAPAAVRVNPAVVGRADAEMLQRYTDEPNNAIRATLQPLHWITFSADRFMIYQNGLIAPGVFDPIAARCNWSIHMWLQLIGACGLIDNLVDFDAHMDLVFPRLNQDLAAKGVLGYQINNRMIEIVNQGDLEATTVERLLLRDQIEMLVAICNGNDIDRGNASRLFAHTSMIIGKRIAGRALGHAGPGAALQISVRC